MVSGSRGTGLTRSRQESLRGSGTYAGHIICRPPDLYLRVAEAANPRSASALNLGVELNAAARRPLGRFIIDDPPTTISWHVKTTQRRAAAVPSYGFDTRVVIA